MSRYLRRFCLMVTLFCLAVSPAFVGKLHPTPEKPVSLRLSYADNPTWPDTAKAPEPEHAFAIIFKSYVETATNGAIKIELFPSSQLGGSRETTEMVKTGTIDLCIETGNMGTFFPEFQVINIPYVFQSDEIAWWVFDNSPFWKELMAKMEKTTNLINLGMGQNGVRNFTNNTRPIREPADMKGIKFRVMQSPVYVKTVEALGAKAIPIAWPELYSSLQTGVIDGQENPVSIIAFVGKLHEVQKYLTLDGHTWSEDMLVMNADKFRSFSDEYQQILRIGGKHGALANRASEALMSRIIGMQILKDNMEVYSPSAEQIKMFQDQAQPPVIAWLKEQIGAEVVDGFMKAVEEAETALGYR